MRKNYAGIGNTQDPTRDAFISPQPYPSWILDETTCRYEAPTSYPTDDKMYVQDEDTLSWDFSGDIQKRYKTIKNPQYL